LEVAAKDRFHDGRKYALGVANIWLHRTPYAGPRTPPARPPLLLVASRQVRVMAPVGQPNPRLPLLGLMVLVNNKLNLSISGENSHFRIYKSLRLSLSDFYRELVG
jgi:hypothetical protein